jgi:DnaJ-domain-containing protein 1
MRREQARRESEARARREQAERERQEQARRNEPPPRGEKPDPRSPEEILGLKPPWTQDDLKTAYKREAGRTHPDKWIGKPEGIRQAMEAEYKNIQEAYRRLRE